jgi:hypothetical protein
MGSRRGVIVEGSGKQNNRRGSKKESEYIRRFKERKELRNGKNDSKEEIKQERGKQKMIASRRT